MKGNKLIISGQTIGPAYPPYIVAEISGNHNGDINRAFRLLETAKQAGADAVKLQTYTADTITIDHDGPEFRIKGGLWDGRSLYELYQEAHTPWEWHELLFGKAREMGLTVFSSPFDDTAVDFLESLKTPAYKVASFEVVDLPLIEKIAATGKPMILSTGMASTEEIGEAVKAARSEGCKELALLHCVSGYPTPPEEVNLRTIADLAEQFDVVAGLSDHTLGIGASVAAVAHGATVIEKHFTLSRADGGVDSAFSMEPEEMKELVIETKRAWQSLGKVRYGSSEAERDSLKFRRSLYIAEDMKKGDELNERNLRIVRPGLGLPPRYFDILIGKKVNQNLKKGTAVRFDIFS